MLDKDWSLKPDVDIPNIDFILNTTIQPLEAPLAAMSIEDAVQGVKSGQIDWITIDPLLGATSTLFRSMPPGLEQSVVEHLSETLYWPLMSAIASDSDVVSEFFNDVDWCNYLHASEDTYFEVETASCRTTKRNRLGLIRDYFKKWFAKKGSVGFEGWVDDFDVSRMLEIVEQNDTERARDMYPFPILPKKKGFRAILRELYEVR